MSLVAKYNQRKSYWLDTLFEGPTKISLCNQVFPRPINC